ncbi:hypothetical protein ABPG74_012635 [Tetrahymena malaccensis]
MSNQDLKSNSKTITIRDKKKSDSVIDIESQQKEAVKEIQEHDENFYKELIENLDDRIPKINCDRGFQHSTVNRVCTIKTCNKKLLCDECIETDHAPIKKYAKKFSEFFKLKKEKKVIKEKSVLDIEFFLQEKQQFMKKLDFAFNMATQTVEKEFSILQDNLINLINETKKEVLAFKQKNYNLCKEILDSLSPQLDEIYFDIDKEMVKVVKVTDFDEMNAIIKKVVDFPDKQKIEQLTNDFRLISFYIKEFESETSLLILKQISPKIETFMSEQLVKISNESEAKRVLIEENGAEDYNRVSIWNSKSVVNYRSLQRIDQDPILCACEIDSQTLAFGTGSPGNNVLIFDRATNQFIDEFQAHEGSVMSIIHYHDSIIITGGSDGVVKFWDITDSENFKTFQAHNQILMCVCKVSNKLFATCSFDNTIKVWNYESASQSPEGTLVGHTDGVFYIALLSEQDNLLMSSSADYNIKIWNLNRLECYGTLKGHNNQVNSLEKYKEDYILSAGDDCIIIMWNWKTFDKVFKIDIVPFSIWSIKLMNDNNSLVVCGEDLSIFILNLDTGATSTKLFGHKSFPRSILQLKSGTLITFGYDCSIKFWRSKNTQE